MKAKITLITLLITCFGFAQNGINYKAIIKDDLGNVVANQNVNVRFTVLEGATNVYQETNIQMTDDNGIIILNIGEGTTTDDFSSINWGNEDHFLMVEIDITGGTAFVSIGTTQFKTVPYAIASGDKSWEVETGNVHVLTKNVGVGTADPTELLHIYDDNTSSINLEVPDIINESQIEFKNGLEAGVHSFFKLYNQSDIFRIALDTDLTAETGYEDRISISNSGLALENGVRINEFSTDATLAGNSNNVVPTEAAVKAYVDNTISAVEKTIIIAATSFTGNQNVNPIIYGNDGAIVSYYSGSSALLAPLSLPIGSTVTSIRFFLRDASTAANVNIEAALLRSFQTATTTSQVFSLSTVATASELNYNTPITIEDNNQYILRVRPTSTWNTIQLRLNSVRITYTE